MIKPMPVAPENVFIALQEQLAGHRIFLACGSDRKLRHAAEDELAWIFEQFPSVKAVFLDGKRKPGAR